MWAKFPRKINNPHLYYFTQEIFCELCFFKFYFSNLSSVSSDFISENLIYCVALSSINYWWRLRESILFDGSSFNPCKLAGSISTQKNSSSLSQCFYNWRCVFCTVNRVLVQIQMWFNDEPTTIARCKSMYFV